MKILRYDFSPCLSRGQPIRVLGNLPYNISTPVLLQMVEWSPVIQMHILCCSKKWRNVVTPTWSKDLWSFVGDVGKAFSHRISPVWPDVAFSPPPKVQSEVIRMILKKRFYQ